VEGHDAWFKKVSSFWLLVASRSDTKNQQPKPWDYLCRAASLCYFILGLRCGEQCATAANDAR
jgi:hypothetical protein